MKTIYLAGPIAGLTLKEATYWRDTATEYLEPLGYTVLNPMRGITLSSSNDILGFSHGNLTPNEILERDLDDVREADIILTCISEISVGTLFELGYAYALDKDLIVVLMGKMKHYNNHPFISETSTQFNSMNRALEHITQFM